MYVDIVWHTCILKRHCVWSDRPYSNVCMYLIAMYVCMHACMYVYLIYIYICMYIVGHTCILKRHCVLSERPYNTLLLHCSFSVCACSKVTVEVLFFAAVSELSIHRFLVGEVRILKSLGMQVPLYVASAFICLLHCRVIHTFSNVIIHTFSKVSAYSAFICHVYKDADFSELLRAYHAVHVFSLYLSLSLPPSLSLSLSVSLSLSLSLTYM